MSAAGRSVAAETGHVRHPDDYFSTPGYVTRAILPFLQLDGRMAKIRRADFGFPWGSR